MIAPKRPPQTDRERETAYTVATVRDGGELVGRRRAENGECQMCHRAIGERHHRQGRDKFNSVPSNLILICGPGNAAGCHGIVHRGPEKAISEGFIVPSWADPAEVPILRYRRLDGIIWRRDWALLDDWGGVIWIGPKEARERMSAIGVEAAVA